MDIATVEAKMKSAIAFFEKELSSIRTSRANTAMLDNIFVDAYGSKTPLNQLGNINIPDSKLNNSSMGLIIIKKY